MFKSSLLSSLLFILLLVSCNSHPNEKLQGTWVESYSQWMDSTGVAHKSFSYSGYTYTFKGDSVHLKNFYPKTFYMAMDTIVSYKVNKNKILLGTTDKDSIQVEITKDSIVFTSNGVQIHRLIFKRLPKRTKEIQWNPKGKQYKTVFEDGGYTYFDFVNDSVVHSFFDDMGVLIKQKWSIGHLYGHTIMVSQYEGDVDIRYSFVDDVVGNKIYLTNYTSEKTQHVFEEQEIATKKPSVLYGTWKLVNKETLPADTLVRIHLPLRDNFDTFRIQEDSIFILKEPFRAFHTWKYYENEQTIILEKIKKVIKVAKVTKDSLVLSMNLSDFESDNRKFTFVRE